MKISLISKKASKGKVNLGKQQTYIDVKKVIYRFISIRVWTSLKKVRLISTLQPFVKNVVSKTYALPF